MGKTSAGLLVYRFYDMELEIFLVHPGGPFWAKKDLGAWSIPKGEFEEGEGPFHAAIREFHEETGFEVKGDFKQLTTRKQPSGKKVMAWAIEADFNADAIKSNTFTIEWPPKSGKKVAFPEVDRAEWYGIDMALKKIMKGQKGFIEDLCKLLNDEIAYRNHGKVQVKKK